jgi:hypothetical protein
LFCCWSATQFGGALNLNPEYANEHFRNHKQKRVAAASYFWCAPPFTRPNDKTPLTAPESNTAPRVFSNKFYIATHFVTILAKKFLFESKRIEGFIKSCVNFHEPESVM